MQELTDAASNYFVTFFEPMRRWRNVDIYYVNDPDSVTPSIRYDEDEAFRPSVEQYRDVLERPNDHRYLLLQPFHYRI